MNTKAIIGYLGGVTMIIPPLWWAVDTMNHGPIFTTLFYIGSLMFVFGAGAVYYSLTEKQE